MFFNKNNRDLDYFRFSLDKKVEFYFETFFEQIVVNNYHIKTAENEIKQLIFKELGSFEFTQIGYQGKSLGVRKMHSELGHLTHDWSIDWEWIIHHITLDYINIGKALFMIENSPNDNKILVYKYLPKDYYDFVQMLYLVDLSTKQPRIFDLKEILQNGHGLKSGIKCFIPLVGVTLWKGFDNNYWDHTELKFYHDHYCWDISTKSFRPDHNFERKIQRKSKIKITIGDKTFYV